MGMTVQMRKQTKERNTLAQQESSPLIDLRLFSSCPAWNTCVHNLAPNHTAPVSVAVTFQVAKLFFSELSYYISSKLIEIL